MKKNINLYILLFSVILSLSITIINKISKNENTPYIASGRTVIIENSSFSMQMDMEQFIPLVLMAEMPYDSPKELIKAQAVVIRTNILHTMGEKKLITADRLGIPYRLPNSLKNLWYKEEKLMHADGIRGLMANLTGMGAGKIFDEKMSYLYKIIRETEGKVLKIEGKVILPLFHEVSNGKTRSGKEVLGEAYSYLKSVQCNEDMEYIQDNPLGLSLKVNNKKNEEDAQDKKAGIEPELKQYSRSEELKFKQYSQSKELKYKQYSQSEEMDVSEIFDALKKHGIVIFKDGEEVPGSGMSADDFCNMLDISHKDKAGYVTYFVLGDVTIDGNDFANALGLQSPATDIECKNDKVLFTTRGIGHGFGMSLHYAKVMAEKGKNYEQILNTFYDAALVRNVP